MLKTGCNGVVYYEPDSLNQFNNIKAAFATRVGGTSDGVFSSLNLSYHRGDNDECVTENFSRICDAAGLECNIVCNKQVHGDRIIKVSEKSIGGFPCPEMQQEEADGFVTDVPGVVLTAVYADCVPILFYDPVRNAIAAVHAGWRGTVAHISEKAVHTLTNEYGTNPKDLIAVIGPSICKCHFEVGEETAQIFKSCLKDFDIVDCQNGKYHVDLWGANKGLLMEAGLLEKNITISGLCTYCEEDLFFSHRRCGDARGSHIAFIEIKEN
ncbi:MAG: peptidoglycan editing factor PgeF [Bacillota bacterium]|nr:peptidoglycan editing factor PgeF [Bacillota bacterium]